MNKKIANLGENIKYPFITKYASMFDYLIFWFVCAFVCELSFLELNHLERFGILL